MPKVVFQIEGGKPVTVDCNVGDNLLELARRANVAIDAPCSGNGSCGKCRIKLVEGELESYPSRHISDEEYAEGWRLSCSSKVVGNCTVFVPDIASAYQSRMKTADLSSPQEVAIFDACQSQLKQSGIHFTNQFRAVVVTMAEPSLDDTMPDNERLTWALEEALGVEKVEIPFCVMVKLAHVLRENSFHVCVKGELLGDTFRCMEVCAPEDTAIVGCAIDIGTTTVTMVLTDLTTGKILAKGSSGNGQIRYGADVINRIIEQGKPGGRKKLQDAILKETLNPIIANLCKSAGVTCPSILRMSVGANTTMNHLLVGVDAQSVRMDPYIPSFFLWNGLLAQDLKIPANPLAPVLIAPNIGSYVGGDITAGTLASGRQTLAANRQQLAQDLAALTPYEDDTERLEQGIAVLMQDETLRARAGASASYGDICALAQDLYTADMDTARTEAAVWTGICITLFAAGALAFAGVCLGHRSGKAVAWCTALAAILSVGCLIAMLAAGHGALRTLCLCAALALLVLAFVAAGFTLRQRAQRAQ